MLRPVFVVCLILSLITCGPEKRKKHGSTQPPPPVGTLSGVAAEQGVPARVLALAAWSMSGFQAAGSGFDPKTSSESKMLLEAGLSIRMSFYGLDAQKLQNVDPFGLKLNATIFSKEVKSQLLNRAPQLFDWILAAAQSLVSNDKKDTSFYDLRIRSLLSAMISAHNQGFTVDFGKDGIYHWEKAGLEESIDLKKLNPGQSRYLVGPGYSLDTKTDFLVQGNSAAILGQNIKMDPKGAPSSVPDFPKIVLRWCYSSAVSCLEFFSKTQNEATHFLSIPGFAGKREVVQFFDVDKLIVPSEGNGEDSKKMVTLPETAESGKETPTVAPKTDIIVTIAGPLGDPDSFRNFGALNWNDYTSLRNQLHNLILAIAARLRLPLEPKDVLSPEFLNQIVVAEGISLRIDDPAVPRTKHSLPTIWDNALFRELLSMPNAPRDMALIRIETPSPGEVILGNDLNFGSYLEPESRLLEIFQDKRDSKAGFMWDLNAKTEVLGNQAKVEDRLHFYRTGVARSKLRFLKAQSRDENGLLLGVQYSMFLVDGIVEK